LDGRQHLTPENIKEDKIRTKYLEERTFKVVRYYNTDVLNNIDVILQDLWDRLQ
jgi:very-short-patch-repair endonuclease